MFQLPEEVKKGIENYRYSLEELKMGKIPSARFRGIRVPWGIYSQRGGKVYMVRIRIPGGVILPSQLKALATASRKYGDGILHITTRQDIQLHNVEIENTIKIMEDLTVHNLSPRGGGGNTVRNVTGCVFSGVCRDEIFDVRGYTIALTEELLREESSFNLPRKFKIAFSGCSQDCAGCLINDVGFLAKCENNKKGFEVFVGGGMGLNSSVGKLLEEFIPAEDLGYCVRAIKNVYYKKGDRRNRHHNRLRFLIEDMGIGEFKKLYRDEIGELKEKEYIALRKINFLENKAVDGKIPHVEDEGYKQFLKYNVQPQRQKGFSNVEVRIPRGDIASGRLVSFAELESDFPGIEFRTSQRQNLIIVWVKDIDLYRLFSRLKDILDGFLYPRTLLDVVVCKGALTCNLGLCNSPGLARELEDLIKREFIGKKIFGKLEIKLNGCPNACGQAPVGKISFYGMVRRVDNRPVPFYRFLLGGRKELEKTKLAEEIGIIPARNIPAFLREFLKKAEEGIGDADIYEFLENGGRDIARLVLGNWSYVPPYSQDKDFYIDWGKSEEFSLGGLGPGECGAGVMDVIESDLSQAKIAIEEAEKKNYSSEEIRQALFLALRSLLIVKGIDPKNEEEAFSHFREKFIDEGLASDIYSNLKEVFNSIREGLSLEERKEKFIYAKRFLEHINELYKNMDSSFNFPKWKQEIRGHEAGAGEAKGREVTFLDLKGTPCPINYVKVKLVLENLNSGDVLEVMLDEGEPIDNVPKSLEGDGHKILKIEKEDKFYRVLVKKGQ